MPVQVRQDKSFFTFARERRWSLWNFLKCNLQLLESYIMVLESKLMLMAINSYHTVEEMNGVRCSVVEKKVSAERAAYIKNILETSGFKTETTEAEGAYNVGVTDVVFNLQHALYARLIHKGNRKQVVTPADWFQKLPTGDYYWQY